jgi:hypothetical protein
VHKYSVRSTVLPYQPTKVETKLYSLSNAVSGGRVCKETYLAGYEHALLVLAAKLPDPLTRGSQNLFSPIVRAKFSPWIS